MIFKSSLGLNLELNCDDQTAKIVKSENAYGNIIVPRSIIYDTKEYIITEISESSFQNSMINTLNFPEDSELVSIGGFVFDNSSIQEFSIPKKLKKIDKNWCYNIHNLIIIKNEFNNPNFSVINDEILVGKSDEKSQNFDIIYFGCRHINSIFIPPCIKSINPYAFSFCQELRTIEFASNSCIEILGQNSFSSTKIKKIKIPSSVTTICEKAFFQCKKLETVEFENDSKLRTLGQNSFSFSSIVDIEIPSNLFVLQKGTFSDCCKLKKISFKDKSKLKKIENECFMNSTLEELHLPFHLEELEEGWCSKMNNLKLLTISEDNKNFKVIEKGLLIGKSNENECDFDSIYFAPRDINEIEIPNTIKHIKSHSFDCCTNLHKVEIKEESQLEIIGIESFHSASIESIFIPKNVKKISKKAFSDCINMKMIELAPGSQLMHIGKNAFYNTLIKKLFIPSKLKELEEGWCKSISYLYHITVSEDNNRLKLIDDKLLIGKSDNDEYDTLYFACRDIKKAKIPSTIKYISKNSFSNCSMLKEIEFSEDSQLKIIGPKSFSYSSINKIKIPDHVTRIEYGAFSDCSNLEKVEISHNSELEFIGKESFRLTKVESIFIPKNVTIIDDYAFNSSQLNKIDFQENSKLTLIGSKAFGFTNIAKIEIPKSVTSIGKECFASCQDIQEIIFAEDAQLTSIGKNSYADGELNNKLYIPPNIESFSEGLCILLKESADFELSPENKNFKLIENKIIIGKSDNSNDDFDTLCFVPCDIKKVIVPSYIKYINNGALSNCINIEKVEFQENSQLRIIRKRAFSSSSIKSIKIPKHVCIIEKEAFLDCDELENLEFEDDSELLSIEKNLILSTQIEKITIPNKVQKLCFSAFNCYKLHEVNFQRNSELKTIERNCFSYSPISEIIIPSSVRIIAKNAFINCNSLQSVQFENNSKLEIISKNAFSGSSIEEITIPKSVKIIGSYAFCDCGKLTTIKFEEGSKLRELGKGCFSNSNIVEIEIPSDLQVLQEDTFSNCREFKKLSFKEGSKLKTIEKRCFLNSTLEEIHLPSDLEELKEEWCKNAFHLINVTVSKDNKHFKVDENGLLIGKLDQQNTSNFDTIYFAPRNIGAIEIPKTIKHIRSYSFSSCINNFKVSFPSDSQLETIGIESFSYSDLEDIFIPNGVIRLPNECFKGCNELKSIQFTEDSKLTSIGARVFNEGLIEFTIPKKLEEIDDNWIFDNYSLSIIKNEFNNPNFSVINNGTLFVGKSDKKSQIFDTIYLGRSDITSLFIPAYIKEIKPSAFFAHSKIQSIEFAPNSSIEIIGKCSFYSTRIKRIRIPSSVKIIGRIAFNFSYLKIIEFEEDSQLTNICTGAFSNLSSLEKILIPKNVKTIEENAFSCCVNLKIIEFQKDSNLTLIGKCAFLNCGIKSICFPASFAHFYSNILNECINLTSVEFLGEELLINDFDSFDEVKIISMPNASSVIFLNSLDQSHDFILLVFPGAKVFQK